MILSLSLVALTVLGGATTPVVAPAPPASEEAANVMRTYNLSALRSEWNGGGSLPAFVPLSGEDAGEEQLEYESYTVFAADEVMEVLYNRIGEDLEYEGRGMWERGRGMLAVRAPEAVHDEIANTLVFLSEVTASHAELTLDIIVTHDKGLGAPELAGLVSRAAAESWLEEGVPGSERSRYVLELSSGKVALVDATRSMPLVFDWDIEIAQGASTLDPQTRELTLGRRLNLSGAPTSNGLMLSLGIAQGELVTAPMTRANRQRALLGSEAGHEFVDMPGNTQFVTVWNRSISCDSMLADNQALVLRFDLAGPEGARYHEAIVIRRTGGDWPALRALPGADGRTLTIIDSSAMGPPRVRIAQDVDFPLPGWVDLNALSWRDGYSEDVPRHYIEMGDPDLALGLLQELRADDDMTYKGPWLLCTENSDDNSEGEDTRPSYSEVVRDNALRAETANLTLELRRNGPTGELLRRASFSVRTGSSNLLALGVEHSYEYGYEVEVAQHAAAADPETRIAFDGLFCTIRLDELPGGQLILAIDGQATDLISNQRFEYGGLFVERAYQPLLQSLGLHERMRMGPDETEHRFVLGNQVSGPGSRGLTLVVNVKR